MYRLFHVKQAASVQGLPDLLIAEGRGEAAVVGDALLGEAFRRACRKEGILYSMTEIIKAYRAPYDPVQTSLF